LLLLVAYYLPLDHGPAAAPAPKSNAAAHKSRPAAAADQQHATTAPTEAGPRPQNLCSCAALRRWLRL